mmetsp:Transcript_41072/g.49989  ORF Transcript_41072/g.49989 Transcript_41072/m.49989 type:complete len:321 (+) Transcript_41072:55-1017(+)
MSFMKAFKDDLPSVVGKVFVITGTTSGVGFEVAKTVASKGGEVVLLNRKSHRADTALEKLRDLEKDINFVCIDCDLQDFESTRQAAKEIKAKYNKIYCLACNAGVFALKDVATKDGYDVQMQVNYLSHYILQVELFPLIAAGLKEYGDARIVTVTGVRDQPFQEKYIDKNGGNLGGDENPMGAPMIRGTQSKLAVSLQMHGLHTKVQESGKYQGLKIISSIPGMARSNVMDSSMEEMNCLQRCLFKNVFLPLGSQSAEAGSMGLLIGMMDTTAKSGVVYGPKGMKGKAIELKANDFETDPVAIETLFKKSEEATGAKFEF